MSPGAKTVLVDGYNVLLGVARREGVRDVGRQLEGARTRLLRLIGDWSTLRRVRVVVAWDGHGAAPSGLPDSVRVAFVEPPAEADDFIVKRAEQRAARGLNTAVVTRDRGLLRRLPRECEIIPFERLVDDLHALAQGPVRGGHVTGPRGGDDAIPASGGPVDTSRLPRRRVLSDGQDDPSLPAPARRGAAAAPRGAAPDAGEAERDAARSRRDARREKWKRAQRRRAATKRKKR